MIRSKIIDDIFIIRRKREREREKEIDRERETAVLP